MTDTELIIEVAKLDNRPCTYYHVEGTCDNLSHRPPYLTSRDAIIPVIEKQESMIVARIAGEYTCLATAKQLSIALVKACGKWKK